MNGSGTAQGNLGKARAGCERVKAAANGPNPPGPRERSAREIPVTFDVTPGSRTVRLGHDDFLMSVALVLEYESVCADPAQRIASGLSVPEVGTVISALCAVAEPVRSRFLWRPQLRDPGDEMVLEAAVNGRADGLVTFNRRDFGRIPERFGVALLSPRQALASMDD